MSERDKKILLIATPIAVLMAVYILLGMSRDPAEAEEELAAGSVPSVEELEQAREDLETVAGLAEQYRYYDSLIPKGNSSSRCPAPSNPMGFVAKVAEQAQVKDQLRELRPRDDGELQRVEGRLEGIVMRPLTDFLFKLENSVDGCMRVTSLTIKRQYRDNEVIDVSFTATAFTDGAPAKP